MIYLLLILLSTFAIRTMDHEGHALSYTQSEFKKSEIRLGFVRTPESRPPVTTRKDLFFAIVGKKNKINISIYEKDNNEDIQIGSDATRQGKNALWEAYGLTGKPIMIKINDDEYDISSPYSQDPHRHAVVVVYDFIQKSEAVCHFFYIPKNCELK